MLVKLFKIAASASIDFVTKPDFSQETGGKETMIVIHNLFSALNAEFPDLPLLIGLCNLVNWFSKHCFYLESSGLNVMVTF